MPITAKELRERIFAERGLVKSGQKGKKKRIISDPSSPVKVPPHLKTDKMRYLEVKYSKPIEQLLTGSLSEVVRRVHDEVDFTTVSKWKKKLKLTWSVDNLPDCSKCGHHGPLCQAGWCSILGEAEKWELVMIKKKELVGE